MSKYGPLYDLIVLLKAGEEHQEDAVHPEDEAQQDEVQEADGVVDEEVREEGLT